MKRGTGTSRKVRPRGWLGLIFWSGWIGFFAWLWPHSWHVSDVLVVYTYDGSVQGVLSHKGHLLLGVSTLSLGRDKALTTEHVAADSADGDWLYDGAFTTASTMHEYWGFGTASCKPGDLPGPAATSNVLLIPHWFPIALGGLSLIWHAWRFTFRTRERRWIKEGRCLTCGYDLRGAPSPRCPECGTATDLATKTEPVSADISEVSEL